MAWLESIGLNRSQEAQAIQFLVALFVIAAFSLVRREIELSRPAAAR
jgi:hypothetical protein